MKRKNIKHIKNNIRKIKEILNKNIKVLINQEDTKIRKKLKSKEANALNKSMRNKANKKVI